MPEARDHASTAISSKLNRVRLFCLVGHLRKTFGFFDLWALRKILGQVLTQKDYGNAVRFRIDQAASPTSSSFSRSRVLREFGSQFRFLSNASASSKSGAGISEGSVERSSVD